MLLKDTNAEDTSDVRGIITSDGGLAIKMLNDTGANSVKGTLVESSADVDNGFVVCGVSSNKVIGVVYEDGLPDGTDVFVVISGCAKVLLKDGTTATHGYWVVPSDTAGRADATQNIPTGGQLQDHELHFHEVGHCTDTKEAGTDVLARCIIHFN